VLALVTVKGWWPYLWREWITASIISHRCDVHRLGAPDAGARLLRRHVDAQPTGPGAGHATGVSAPEHYDQIFSAHGTIMIFFVAMPFVIGP